MNSGSSRSGVFRGSWIWAALVAPWRILREGRRQLTAYEWRVVAVLGTANFIDSYDIAILGLALPQIQEGLDIAESDIGGLTAVIRLGVLPALLLTLLADSLGRRRLLLLTILGFTLATFVTAFAGDASQFTAFQFVARMFIVAEGMLAVVVIAEEIRARYRGWGIGVLSAFGTLGHGLASVIFALVDLLPYGWRALYALGAVPLLLLAWFRRSLRETRRFIDYQERTNQQSAWRNAVVPVKHLIKMYPGRLVALCAALLPVAFTLDAALIFVSKTLQQTHGYAPAQVTLLFLTVGIVAPAGNLLAGWLGDRWGRKQVLVVAMVANALGLLAFYNLSGPLVPVAFGVMLLSLQIISPLFAALGAELFPTSYRSTASGVRQVVTTIGGALGLLVEGVLYSYFQSHPAAISTLVLALPIAPVIVWFWLPETANRELEEVSPER
ncbi:Putative niacin/nicotinamide transporter NaiP [bacterium HR30]|nr:Putative niacin/nicotinamide transporter NaiP [bacterium HR30]